MSGRRKWPAEAKWTVAVLVVLVLVIAGIRAPDEQPQQVTTATTTTPVVTSAATSSSTTATTTLPRTSSSTVASTPPTTSSPTVPPPPVTQPTPAPAPPSSVSATLDRLPVTNPDYSRPYKRADNFGPAWADDNDMAGGHNGCDTRNDILHRDLTDIEVRPGTRNCVVIAGVFTDPYGGSTATFAKERASEVQIDHIVPLYAAWQLGAWQWPQRTRVNFANDPDVLVASNGRLNAQKGSKLADEWKPPNTGYWCTYATKTVNVHAKYELAVTSRERAALHEMLATC